ncbi:hypothetical protein CYMTET_13740 [Cymbomonas tetramitiformis]|uniref:Ankyrin repeat domain-containing protein 17 n=1 Tax=Cymbomonas tetramitiformis TaxID=36881 RepID=A0AAE0GHR9_9CHLO|nr:hypothetical protein CYMTET_13740 [Cymbomonas tetramitiformis]|eukprot:gene3636-4573_t
MGGGSSRPSPEILEELKNAKTELEKKQVEHDKQLQKLERVTVQEMQTREELEKAKGKLQQLQQQNVKNKNELEEAHSEMDKALRVGETSQRKVDDMQEKLEMAAIEIRRLNTLVEDKLALLQQTKGELGKLAKLEATVRKQLQHSEKQSEHRESALHKQLHDARDREIQMQEQLAALKEEKRGLYELHTKRRAEHVAQLKLAGDAVTRSSRDNALIKNENVELSQELQQTKRQLVEEALNASEWALRANKRDTSPTRPVTPACLPPAEVVEVEIWDRAVSVQWLVQFTVSHKCTEWPTWQVVRDIIRRHTSPAKCRYVELPSMVPVTGPTDVFVSHSWGSTWGDLVAVIAHSLPLTCRVWLDVFAVLQWPESESGRVRDHDLKRISAVIALSRGMLTAVCCSSKVEAMLSVPYAIKKVLAGAEVAPGERMDRRVPFTRAWCLQEMYYAAVHRTPVVVVAGRTESAGSLVYQQVPGTVFPSLEVLTDASTATAADPMDLEKIAQAIGDCTAQVTAAAQGAVAAGLLAANFPVVRHATLTGDLRDLCAKMAGYAANQRCSAGVAPLEAAAALGRVEVVRAILTMGGTEGLRDALVAAADAGQVGALQVLLARVKPNGRGRDGRTALVAAASKNHGDTVQVLLEAGANMSEAGADGRLPVAVAAAAGHAEAFSVLAAAGAALAAPPAERQEPLLMLAARGGDSRVVVAVMEALESSPTELPCLGFQDVSGMTPLAATAAAGAARAAVCLLEAGAALDQPLGGDHSGQSLLMHAAAGGCIEVVRRILGSSALAEASLRAADQQGVTALMHACAAGQSEPVMALLEAVGEMESRAQMQVIEEEARGHTLMVKDVEEESAEIPNAEEAPGNEARGDENGDNSDGGMTMESGAPAKPEEPPIRIIQVVDKHGRSALHHAACASSVDVVRAVLRAGAELERPDAKGCTPLLLAAGSPGLRSVAVVKMLLLEGANRDAVDARGYTALMRAAISGRTEIAEILIQGGSAVDVQASDGMTPLLCAAGVSGCDQAQVVQSILKIGARLPVVVDSFARAATMAQMAGNKKVMMVLKDAQMTSQLPVDGNGIITTG